MTDIKPKRGPRGAFQPTEEQRKNVKISAALGVPQIAICAIIRDHKDRPISENTLRKHFRKEIETGATELNAQVGNFMVATILGIDPPKGVYAHNDREGPRLVYRSSRALAAGWDAAKRATILPPGARRRKKSSRTARPQERHRQGPYAVEGGDPPRHAGAALRLRGQ